MRSALPVCKASEMERLRNVTASSSRPTTDTLTQFLHDYALFPVANFTNGTYTLISWSLLSAALHSKQSVSKTVLCAYLVYANVHLL